MNISTITRHFSRQSRWPELNWRPTPYHGVALPTELQRLSREKYPTIVCDLRFFGKKHKAIWYNMRTFALIFAGSLTVF